MLKVQEAAFMRDLPISVDPAQIADFCENHHIIKLAFFGSVLTDKFGPESDVDVLVEFDPEHIPTLFDVLDMEESLSLLLGRKADIRTPNDLGVEIRERVISNALVHYAA
jgi:predicted nucleotidyltransferase